MSVKYPEIEAKLIGGSGNIFGILGTMHTALRRGGVSEEERQQFDAEAKSGDYDNALQVCMKWVTVT